MCHNVKTLHNTKVQHVIIACIPGKPGKTLETTNKILLCVFLLYLRRRMKAHAPPPPQAPQPAPRRIFKSAVHDGGGISGVDTKENILRHTVDFQLTLPNGHQTAVTEDGR